MIAAIKILSPLWHSLANKALGRAGGSRSQALKVGVMGVVIWMILLVLCTRFVVQFAKYPEIADLLLIKMLGISMTAAAGLTIIATSISGLSVFFTASDLKLLLVAPIDWLDRFLGQFVRAAMTGSWAVALVFTPVLFAVGRQYHWPPGFIATALIGGVSIVLMSASIGILVAFLLAHLGGAGRAKIGMALVAGVVVSVSWWIVHQGGLGAQLLQAGKGSALAMIGLLQTPDVSWAPTDWWARSLVQSNKQGLDILALASLISIGLILTAILGLVYRLAYRRILSRANLGIEARHSSANIGRIYAWSETKLGTAKTALLAKDLTRLIRASSDWSHWILAGAGYTLYVSNLGALSLASEQPLQRLLAQCVAIVSLGVGSLILASLAVHTLLPSISLEGPGLAVLRVAPLSRGLPIRVKFAWGSAILVPLGVFLSVWAEYRLGGKPSWLWAVGAMSLTQSVGVVGLALWFGVKQPVFNAKSSGEVSGSSGATAFLLAAIGLIIVSLLCIAPFAFTVMAVHPQDFIRQALRSMPYYSQLGLFGLGVLLPGVAGVWLVKEAEKQGLRLKG